MFSTISVQPPVPGYIVRRFTSRDAAGVTRLVESVYEDSYYPRELYDPEQIVRLNEAGRLVSVVALTADELVGHYALERPHPAAVAEASDAIVLMEHRHHHLMEQMRIALREEAIRLGLAGLVGYPVTNHIYSQKAEDHFGSQPCGVALGLWPRSFHNMPEPLPQRMSFVIYFKYLRTPERVVHVPTHHEEIVSRIYGRYNVPVELSESGEVPHVGEFAMEYESAVEAGSIRVRQVGRDTADNIRRARRELCDVAGAKAVTLELPLAQAGMAEVCRDAEKDGFFFCGVGPSFAADGDVLILQYLCEEIDPSLLQMENPFSEELLAYVSGERERVKEQ